MRDFILFGIMFGLLPFCFLRPWVGVLVFSWISYMNPHRFTWGAAYDFPFAKIVAVITIIGLFLTRDKMSLPKTRETILIILLGLFFTLTSFYAFNHVAVWAQWEKVIKILIMTLVSMTLINEQRKLKYLIMVISLSIGLLGVKGGIFSFATGGEFRVYGPSGSFFADNNDMALALNMTLPMLFYLARGGENNRLKTLFWFIFVMDIIAIIFTYSRGGFVTLAAVMVMLLSKSRYKIIASLLLSITIFVVVSMVPEQWFARMETIETYEESRSFQGRINAWHTAWNIAKDRPFIGGGFETFIPQIFLTYAPAPLDIHDVHSIYFEILGEHGFIAFGLYIALILSTLLTAQNIKRFASNDVSLKWAAEYSNMFQISLFAYMIGGVLLGRAYFDLFYHIIAMVIVMKVFVVKGQAGYNQIKNTETRGKTANIRRAVYILCIIAFSYSGGVSAKEKEVVLADFESGIHCSDDGDIVGFRRGDKARATIVKDGADGSIRSALFRLLPSNDSSTVKKDIFLQGRVRRMYLPTKSTKYDENGPNALSFWIKLKPDSLLISKEDKNTFGVWTYHWRFDDPNVGGNSNNELATDSMMHGYANFRFNEKAVNKWVKVVLTPSAFKQSRYYYHFYAARGITDGLQFFPSLRQLQFHIFPEVKKEEHINIDQIKLVHLEPTAIFEKEFFKAVVSKDSRDVVVPVVIKNPTKKDRNYRVFISSFLGVQRDALYVPHVLTDSFEPPRIMQAKVNGDGGIGAVEIIAQEGDSIVEQRKEIFIPAHGVWHGRVIHHIKPDMLGHIIKVDYNGHEFHGRRDTLTTSIIVWDPYDESVREMEYIEVPPSNADDGNHRAPHGFPPQKRPPAGWRSEDIPINQVGGYFVSVIQLTD